MCLAFCCRVTTSQPFPGKQVEENWASILLRSSVFILGSELPPEITAHGARRQARQVRQAPASGEVNITYKVVPSNLAAVPEI